MDKKAQEILTAINRYAFPTPVEGGHGTWLRQSGEIRLGPARWVPFRAEQRLDAVKLEFRWVARARMSSLVRATVTDAFEDGHGRFEVRVLGLPIQRAAGPDFDVSELLRFLAELAWCPLAFNHSALSWTAIDERTLHVELLRTTVRAGLSLEVDELGRVRAVRAESRPRRVGKTTLSTPWGGQFGSYREYGGIRIPGSAEVFWELPEGEFTYFRGEILAAGLLGAKGPHGSRAA